MNLLVKGKVALRNRGICSQHDFRIVAQNPLFHAILPISSNIVSKVSLVATMETHSSQAIFPLFGSTSDSTSVSPQSQVTVCTLAQLHLLINRNSHLLITRPKAYCVLLDSECLHVDEEAIHTNTQNCRKLIDDHAAIADRLCASLLPQTPTLSAGGTLALHTLSLETVLQQSGQWLALRHELHRDAVVAVLRTLRHRPALQTLDVILARQLPSCSSGRKSAANHAVLPPLPASPEGAS